jgi:YVTN family beta-propeller protein
VPVATPRRFQLVARRLGRLAQPIQDAAAAALARGPAVLLGGLTPADVSSDTISIVTSDGSRVIGRLPGVLHDAAAVAIHGSVYLFGGGNGSLQLDQILRITRSGRVEPVGRLPAPSSDQAAAAIGATAYVVGGFTGTRWLNTIVAWRPGTSPRVVARLPRPLRYAAVTAAAGRLVIAGGSLPSGHAGREVLSFDPRTRRLRVVGLLPAPTTHAAAASLGKTAYVIGGRGDAANTPARRVVAVDPRARRVRVAARLPVALSDAAAVTLAGRILVAGGRDSQGTTDRLTALALEPVAPAGATTRPKRAATPTLDVYAHDRAPELSAAARLALPRIYVPNSLSGTVDVIDPQTYKVVQQFPVGLLPQHVTPAWNLRTLYVLNDAGNSITPIDPRTAKPGRPIPVPDPYNMYFTTNGRYAIVVAERLQRLDFRNAHTFRLHRSLAVPCAGVDHMDFSADGRYAIASCEFSGQLVKIDVQHEQVLAALTLPDGRAGMPQDVKLSPDGRIFYVADQHANGLWEISATTFRVTGLLPTGRGVHGLYPSRDTRYLYATNRGEGSISVISFRTRKIVTKWRIPGGGSPDMGGVSADGKVLWLSGRYNAEVYAVSTRTGRLLARIPVGRGPHGLCVWPQPGRYSLGHTGILR